MPIGPQWDGFRGKNSCKKCILISEFGILRCNDTIEMGTAAVGPSGRPMRQRHPTICSDLPAASLIRVTTIQMVFARRRGFRPEAENGERGARGPRTELHRSRLGGLDPAFLPGAPVGRFHDADASGRFLWRD
jgi:hypothetical protein